MVPGVSGQKKGRTAPGAAIALAVALLAAGCGTTCDDASTICGFETTESPTDCTGATECASLCIVDWDGCDVNNAESHESKCIAQCLAQPEAT